MSAALRWAKLQQVRVDIEGGTRVKEGREGELRQASHEFNKPPGGGAVKRKCPVECRMRFGCSAWRSVRDDIYGGTAFLPLAAQSLTSGKAPLPYVCTVVFTDFLTSGGWVSSGSLGS